MKIWWCVLALTLSGCTPGESQEQQVLDSYALSAASGELSQSLTGAALFEAEQSQRLLSQLGWRQEGVSRFTNLQRLGEGVFSSCLDISQVRFFDQQNQPVEIDRSNERLLMRITFDSGPTSKIALLEEVGLC
jgi:hypothetical protein